MSVPAAILSCQQCTRRKIKCDKLVPNCSACSKAGLECNSVQRHRLPRGRTGRNAKGTTAGSQVLIDRVARLEAMVSTIKQKAQTSYLTEDHSMHENWSYSGPTTDAFVAPDFWSELTDTVAGLRNILEDSDVAVVSNGLDSASPKAQMAESSGSNSHFPDSANPHLLLFGTPSAADFTEPAPEMREYLLDVYQARVDAIFKVLHWPTALAILNKGQVHGLSKSNTSRQALASAIYFTAVCSLMNHELEGRRATLEQYRRNVEAALSRASLLTTSDLVTLQAFVIYLAGLRACQANAQQWTLVAVAIRLASATGSGAIRELQAKLSPLETELGHRLWCSIGVLDMQSSFDRGSQPLLDSKSFRTFPKDGHESDKRHIVMTPAVGLFSEMSFSLLTYHAGQCQRRLTELGISAAEGATDLGIASRQQVVVLADFEGYVRRLSDRCAAGDRKPIQDFTVAVAQESLTAMRLLLHRPLHKRGNGFRPPMCAPIEGFDVLTTATEVLERSQLKRSWTAFAQWAWFSWVKWYALAVVLAELCCTKSELADRAWLVAQVSYDDYAKIVADSESGLLWKPIMKLMRKVQQVRSEPNGDQTSVLIEANTHSGCESKTVQDQPALNATRATKPSERTLRTEPEQTPGLRDDVSINYGGQSHGIADDMSWLHWDLLIDDINTSNFEDSVW